MILFNVYYLFSFCIMITFMYYHIKLRRHSRNVCETVLSDELRLRDVRVSGVVELGLDTQTLVEAAQHVVVAVEEAVRKLTGSVVH